MSRPRRATPGKACLVDTSPEAANDFESEVHFRIAQTRKHLSDLAAANAAADARRSGLAAREIELHLEYARTASDASFSPELRAIVEGLRPRGTTVARHGVHAEPRRDASGKSLGE